MTLKKLNCWEFKKCGRGPGRTSTDELGICPAARENRLNGVHGGRYSGRACWTVAGTFCGGRVQGTFAKKSDACKACDFYNLVLGEEGPDFQQPVALLKRLKRPGRIVDISTRTFGVLIGGSGLIGGALMHYFKTETRNEVEVIAPNSKRLSLREPEDIRIYFQRYKPDFIINCAVSAINSDARLSYETNYLGSINLAKVAMALKIPYIHFSSAATLPMGENFTEQDHSPLTADLPFYPRSKLMAEMTLRHLGETRGLDCTIIRLGVVYGKHDHKIQGFQRMLFSIVDQAMLFLPTRRGVMHSYTNSKKIPPFVHYILENRDEFSGETYHFVDRNPVELGQLILAIRSYLDLNFPKELYLPYPLVKRGRIWLEFLLRRLNRIGIEARMPAELMFLEYFFNTQSLSADKLHQSSYGDSSPDITIYTELPDMIKYYCTRWKHLNLISAGAGEITDVSGGVDEFIRSPDELVNDLHQREKDYFTDYDSLSE
ncbi:MAG: NAD-dependent epimerase/dehydratase family protein [Desulfobacterales bacterium]|nr:NAD-dependent epimerase/dehydratase family protein [Desulfobacterales bacterium]